MNKGWKGFGDWLGNGNISNADKKFKPFEEARALVRALGLKSQNEWRIYAKSKRPEDIPAHPDAVYPNWVSMGDWLGTNKVADQYIEYLDYYSARDFVQTLGIKTGKEFARYCKSPEKNPKIPLNVRRRYTGKGWINMGEFLGTGNVANYNRKYKSFPEAKKYVQKLKIKNQSGWNTYCKSGKKPINIPATPDRKYKNKGWISWGDFLGKK